MLVQLEVKLTPVKSGGRKSLFSYKFHTLSQLFFPPPCRCPVIHEINGVVVAHFICPHDVTMSITVSIHVNDGRKVSEGRH